MSILENDALSAYIDNQLPNDEAQSLEQDIRSSEDLSLQIQVIQQVKSLTKNYAMSTRSVTQMPSDFLQSIHSALDNEQSLSSISTAMPYPIIEDPGPKSQSILSMIKSFFVTPSYSLVGVGLLLIFCSIVSFKYLINNNAGINFKTESYTNFNKVLKGTLTVQKATTNMNDLIAFFKSNGVNYELVDPSLNGTLVGGVISEHDGQKLAHFVYSCNGHIVYMYEAPETLFNKHILDVPNEVVNIVESGKWYCENDKENHSWMFWRVKSTYCSVVADMSKDELAKYFVGNV